jgi:hypothetical protein
MAVHGSAISSAALQRFECVDAMTYAGVSADPRWTRIASVAAATRERGKFFVHQRMRCGREGLSCNRREESDMRDCCTGVMTCR